MGVVLGFGDHAAVAGPGAGAVVEFAEEALRLLGPGEGPGRLVAPPFGLRQQPAVLGHADDVMHIVALAPRQQQRAAETGVAAEDDAHARPRLAQPGDQQFQNRRRMQRRVLLRRTQVGDQQLLAAEHVQRQEAVVVVVGTEVTPFLIAVNQIVGGVEVEHQFFRRALERSNELFDQNPLRGHRRGAISAVLEPAQGRAGGRRLILAHRRLQRQVVAQPVVVVEVFVTLAQTEHPLSQQLLGGVLHQPRVARIRQHLRHRLQQSESSLDLPQQQQPAVGTDIATIKTDVNLASSELRKRHFGRGTIWHRRNLHGDQSRQPIQRGKL